MTTPAQREAFEAYASGEKYHRYDFTPFAGGTVKGRTYLDMTTELAFRSWQAALKQGDGWVSVKRSAVDCANHLAVSSERLLDCINEFIAADNAEEEAETDAEREAASKRVEAATDAFDDHRKGVREAIYEYRRRIDPAPPIAAAQEGGEG